MEIIGHRGAMGFAPENSLAGFDIAVAQGVDWIELDVRLSKDGQLVVIHDADLRRLTGHDDKVADLAMAEMAKRKTLSGEQIVSLETALKHIKQRAKVCIELKEAETAQPLAQLLKAKFSGDLAADNFLIASFISDALYNFHLHLPQVPTAQIRRWWPFVTQSMISLAGLQSVVLRHNWARRVFIKRLQRQGLSVYVYGLSDDALLPKLQRLGVTGVVLNRPEKKT